MNRLLLLALSALLAACGGGTAAEPPAPAAAPIVAGHAAATMGDGTTLAYTLVLPPEYDPARSYPVLLALPPGGQDQVVVDSVIDRVWRAEAERRGWVVASPVAPGALFFDDSSARYLPELVAQLVAQFRPASGKVHLAGVSNGGLSAFRAALDHPELYLDLAAFPGYPPSPDADISRLKGIPVAIWVGADDAGWLESGQTAVADLNAAGGSAEITVVAGEGHILETVGGKEYLDFLERQETDDGS